MVKWSDFVAWLFFALLSYFAWDMNSTMKDMSVSVNTLNTAVAVMLVRQDTTAKDIEKMDVRLQKLEGK